MGRIIGRIIIMLCCTILLAAASHAKTAKKVYLKDGGIIECQNVWQANGKVMVLVNKYDLVDLSKGEVDLKRTFGKKTGKHLRKHSVKMASQKTGQVSEVAQAGQAEKPAAAPVVPRKPLTAAKPAEKPVTTAAKPAVPAPKQQATEKAAPAAPAAKQPLPAAKPAQPEKPAATAAPQPAAPAKAAVQNVVSSAKAPAPATAEKPAEGARANLPLAKPVEAPMAEGKSFLAENMTTLGLLAALALLVIFYIVYKKKQND
jgi:hypothetical protein